MSSANKGSASALSRWCSHSRPITYSNNLLGAMGLHHLLAFGAGIKRTREDLAQSIAGEMNLASRVVLNLVYILVILPFTYTYFAVLLFALIVNELWRVAEQTLYLVIYLSTLCTFNFSRMNSFYGTFMMLAEAAVGKLWHDSVIRLVTPKRPCALCKADGCKQGKCYSLVKGFLFDEMRISCECFKKHLSNRMELPKEKDGCRTSFEQTDRVTEGRYLLRSSSVERYYNNGCGVFDDEVIERHYDMERSMWVSVRLETSDDAPSKLATVRISRDDLDEVVDVPISSPDRLFVLPELRYAFLKNRARTEGASDIVYTPVILVKRFSSLLLATLGVRFASKTYHEERLLAMLLIVTLAVYYAINLFRERVTIENIGGEDSRVSRMLAIDALSSGTNLIKYGNTGTSWTRHIGYGGKKVGQVDMLENILHNRAIVMGDKMLSLSKEGTAMYIADVAVKNGSVQRNGSDPAMVASKWRKADRGEVVEATKDGVPDLNDMIG